LHIRRILERCLDKDRRTRIPDMSVVRFLMADASTAEPSRAAGGASRMLAWAIAAALAVALAISLWSPWKTGAAATSHPVSRFTIAPQGALLSAAGTGGPIALSPDGRRIAYVTQTESGTRMIGVRDMDRLESRMLRETESQGTVTSAGYPFFSPDGEWIGFVTGGALKKVPVAGGPVSTICSFTLGWRGATWMTDGTIVIALEGPAGNGLYRVPATGGALTPIALVEKGELSYRWPDALPGRNAVIFTVHRGGDASSASIVVQQLDTKERRVLVEGGSYPRYVSSGHVVFTRAGVLMAAPFDLSSLTVTGVPSAAVQQVSMAVTTGQSQFAVSASGTLVYANLTDEGAQNLVWVDRQGVIQPINAPPQNYEHPRLSPDGQRIAMDIRGYGGGATTDIWVYQFARGTLSRLTFGGTESEAPVWTPDGARVTYAVTLQSQPPRAVAWKRADNSDSEEQIGHGDAHLHPLQWNPGGDVLLLNESASTGSDIWAFSMKDKSLRPITKTPYKEVSAGFSPDGRWLTYASDETGRFEIYAQAFPGPGGRSQISANGGVEPVWARNGRELFYREGDKMMSVPIPSGSRVPEGTPKVLFQGRFMASTSVDRWYDVTADGQRFLMLKPQDSARSVATLTVVQGWDTELKRLTAPKP
jgi:serine/threonine-protein kinase